MSEWMQVMKKPLVVQARHAAPEDEEMIRRREGAALEVLGAQAGEEAWPHYMVMKGREGEEYPIKRSVFMDTYEVVSEAPREKEEG